MFLVVAAKGENSGKVLAEDADDAAFKGARKSGEIGGDCVLNSEV